MFARKKYDSTADSDKQVLKRFTVTSKDFIIDRIKQLQCSYGAYSNSKGEPISQEALALYVTVNPRDLKLAQVNLAKVLIDKFIDANNVQNVYSLALTSIHNSKSKSIYIDFDFDTLFPEDVISCVESIIPRSCFTPLLTQGGVHIMVNVNLVKDQNIKTNWHQAIKLIPGCDVTEDNLVPVPGCRQGNFVLKLL